MAMTVKRLIDPREVERAYHLLVNPGQVVEIRALEASTQQGSRYTDTLSGYFDNLADLLKAISTIQAALGIYLTLQPCHPDLLHRAKNKLVRQKKGSSTSDKDITQYAWLPIDCDPERVSGISSTDEEHEQALAHARMIRDEMQQRGWPAPVLADSSNGAHLHYKIDLAITGSNLVERVLKGLAAQFDTSDVHVDQTLFNPSRIIKLYGTLACKGDDTSERPHRMSRLLEVPEQLQVVSRELLEAIAAPAPAAQPQVQYRVQNNGSRPQEGVQEEFTAENFLHKNNVAVKSSGPYEGGTRYLLEACAWDPSHTDNSACVYQFPNSSGGWRLAASCSHNSCRGKGWRDFRIVFEPDAYTQRSAQASKKQTQPMNGDTGTQEREPVDISAIDQAIANNDVDAIIDSTSLLASLPTEEYMKCKRRIKEAFGKDINLNELDKAVNARRAAGATRIDQTSADYGKTDEGMTYMTKYGPALCSNFTAEVITDITTDDGAETTRFYEIEAALFGRRKTFEVPAKEFASCNWSDEHLGARAIITTGQSMKSHFVNAVRTCSDPQEEFHYAHTGWRKVDGSMVYLHSGGFLGQVGQVTNDHKNYLTHQDENTQSACEASLGDIKSVVGQVGQVGQVKKRIRVKLGHPLDKYQFEHKRGDVVAAIRASHDIACRTA